MKREHGIRASHDNERGESSLDHVSAHWQRLPSHVREAIVTLVDAAIAHSDTKFLDEEYGAPIGEHL